MARRNRALRALDVHAGIPLVRVLGLARRRRNGSPPAAPASVGILTNAAIGDTILLSGIIQDIRAKWPEARIVFFAGRDNAAAARLLPCVDEVAVVPATRPLESVRVLRRHAVDLLIDTGQWARLNAVLSALAGARFTVGFRTPGQYRHYGYDAVVDHSASVHEVENFRALAHAAGVATTHHLAVGIGDAIASDRIPARPFAVCHMWSAGMNGWLKEWPAERWAALIDRLRARGLHVVLTGSEADAPRAADFCRRPDVAAGGVTDAAGRFSLRELAGVLAASSVVVSVNTGIMHLAAVAGAPTVSLDGPVPARRWGPVGPNTRSVSSSFEGCGFLNLGWEYASHRGDCMEGIAVDDVIAAVNELLPGPSRRSEAAGHG